MNQNTKTVALTLLATTLVAAGATFASSVNTTSTGNTFGNRPELTAEQKAQFEAIKTILDKKKAGTTLTADEQTQLDTFEANKPKMWEWKWLRGGHGKWGEKWEMWEWNRGFWGPIMNLTDEEKTKLESMSDTEKTAFFEAKRSEMEAKQEVHETVIDKLLAGTALTADEESLRQDIIKERAEMKAKKEEMKVVRTIMDKKRNGETLTTDEQTKLDIFEANKTQKLNN